MAVLSTVVAFLGRVVLTPRPRRDSLSSRSFLAASFLCRLFSRLSKSYSVYPELLSLERSREAERASREDLRPAPPPPLFERWVDDFLFLVDRGLMSSEETRWPTRGSRPPSSF